MSCRKRSSSDCLSRVRHLNLELLNMETEYELRGVVGRGSFGELHLAQHRSTDCTVVLKAICKQRTKLRDFLREFHYAHFLSPHKHIVMTYDVAFQTPEWYVFAEEHAAFGDIAEAIDHGLLSGDQQKQKSVVRQVCSALEFMHSKDLVHGDVRPHNVLIFAKDFSVVKLTDFGLTRPRETFVKRTHHCPAYTPPEVCAAVFNEGYTVRTSSDVWQVGILVILCVSARLPWRNADTASDQDYAHFARYRKRKEVVKAPGALAGFSERLLRMLRRLLDPKPSNRPEVTEVFKYLEDEWLRRRVGGATSKGTIRRGMSMKEDGNKEETLSRLMARHGLETTVDREAKRRWISDWIQRASSFRR